MSDVSLMAGHRSFREPLASSASLGCWGQQEKQSTLTSSLSIFHTHTHTYGTLPITPPPNPLHNSASPAFCATLSPVFLLIRPFFLRHAFRRCSLLGSGGVRGRDAALSLCSVSPLSASVRAEEERRRSGAGRERGGYKKKRKKERRARRGGETPTHPRRVANWSAETELAAVVVTLDFKATIRESDNTDVT